MPKVFLSPSNQFANKYAYGNTSEGTQMGLVATELKKSLERCGISVMLIHDANMSSKCEAANKWGADLYIPIHSNACNGSVSGTRMFCYAKSGAGYKACLDIFNNLAPITPGKSESITVDRTLYEVYKPNAPTAYIEVDFHDVSSVAKWIIGHIKDIAEAICKGVCKYFNVKYIPVGSSTVTAPTTCTVTLPILRKGDKNGYVRTLQTMLNDKDGARLTKDGDFGPATEAKVITHQKKHGLGADGIVGAKTWASVLK